MSAPDLLICGKCRNVLSAAPGKRVVCRTCEHERHPARVVRVLACQECRKPLAAGNSGACWCLSCDALPPVHEAYRAFLCSRCFVPVNACDPEAESHVCPLCRTFFMGEIEGGGLAKPEDAIFAGARRD